ncbi:unnamed protein product [Cylicostephanus goldi]|uniref:Uncharacterized protein n=1 Tax=Cylicostephanus goldi TaxID=71465 RepID=A0A3P6TJ53_CYLGO|nr:unnamed protein product [Cylicostephanus goldi]
MILSKVVQRYAEELSEKLQNDGGDVFVAMRHVFDDGESSPAKVDVKIPSPKKPIAAVDKEARKNTKPVDSGKEHHDELSAQKKMKIDPEDVTTERRPNGKRHIPNETSAASPPRTKKLNKDIFDDGDSSPEKSRGIPEPSSAKPVEETGIKVEGMY